MQKLLVSLVGILLVAGCAAPDTAIVTPTVALGDEPVHPGPWQVGDWWDVRFYMDLGPGYREEGAGKVVVASVEPGGYRLLAAERDLAALDYYFDLFFVGLVDEIRRPVVEGETVALFPQPLAPGRTWASWFPVPVFGPDRIQSDAVDLSADVFDTEAPDGRLRISGRTDTGFFLDLDYSPATNWFSYVRLTESATGRIALMVDVEQHGTGFTGSLHHIEGTVLLERLVITPPCSGPGACDPALANVPRVVTVDAGSHQFAETVAYLFSFPLTDAGGAAVEVLTTDPKGAPTRFSHAGVGDRFDGRFFRLPHESDPSGTWSFQYHIIGTGGVYTALYGLDDAVLEL